MEKNYTGRKKVKAVIELNWKIVVGILAGVIAIVIISLFVFMITSGSNLAEGAATLCRNIFSNVFGENNPIVRVCDFFVVG